MRLNAVFVHIATTVRDFRQRSFIEWDFQDRYYEQLTRSRLRTDIQLMFRTRRESGLLLKAQNGQKSEYVVLEVTATSCHDEVAFVVNKSFQKLEEYFFATFLKLRKL